MLLLCPIFVREFKYLTLHLHCFSWDCESRLIAFNSDWNGKEMNLKGWGWIWLKCTIYTPVEILASHILSFQYHKKCPEEVFYLPYLTLPYLLNDEKEKFKEFWNFHIYPLDSLLNAESAFAEGKIFWASLSEHDWKSNILKETRKFSCQFILVLM